MSLFFSMRFKGTLFFLFFSQVYFTQKSNTGNWLIYFGNQTFKTKWNWYNEAQYRNYNAIGDLEQLVLRTGFGYNLSENNNNILVGYSYIVSQRYIKADSTIQTEEHRVYQQFITRQRFGRFYLQHRYRLEERFFANSPVRYRARYFLGVTFPFNKPSIEKNTLYLSVYDEIFINIKAPVFDRNRVYGALGFAFNANFRIELGVMSQLFEKTNRSQFQVVVFNNLPFPKRKKLSVTAQ
jgi:hypothetical protein